MIRVIVFAVIGLVIGLGGGSGVAVMKAKKALAAAHDSTAKADSTKHNAAVAGEKGHEEEATPAGPAVPTVVAHADSAPTIAPVPAMKHDSVATPPVAAVKPPTADTAHAASPAVPGRIAKIFAAMSAKDAARVLQQMDDSDVQTVLSGLNDRQAAAILAGFPPERAAAISRASLRKKGAS